MNFGVSGIAGSRSSEAVECNIATSRAQPLVDLSASTTERPLDEHNVPERHQPTPHHRVPDRDNRRRTSSAVHEKLQCCTPRLQKNETPQFPTPQNSSCVPVSGQFAPHLVDNVKVLPLRLIQPALFVPDSQTHQKTRKTTAPTVTVGFTGANRQSNDSIDVLLKKDSEKVSERYF